MKIFILWDMEGTSGLFMREQTWYWEPAVRPEIAAEGKQLLIDDVNSLSTALLAAGADELIVCDTHHGGGNIVMERMLQDPRITYLGRSVGYDGSQWRLMPGLDHTVDAFMLPGHHAKAGTPNAFLPHTSSLAWADFRINGQSVGEMGIESCFAAHWDVPLIFAQGDAAGCAEAEEQFAGVVTACVKHARSRDFAEGLDAAEARQLTASRATEAIARARKAKPRPFKPNLPMTVTVQMTTVAEAEKVASRPGVRRVDDLTVEGIAERHCDVMLWLNGTGLDMPPRA